MFENAETIPKKWNLLGVVVPGEGLQLESKRTLRAIYILSCILNFYCV